MHTDKNKKRIKIGFDAKWFFNGNPSGKVIVTNLLKQIIFNYPEYDFYIFLKKKDKKYKFPLNADNVFLIYVGGRINLLSNVLFIPIKLIKIKVDLFIFQYFAPLFLNTKKISFINDVIFKTYPQYFTFLERIYFFPMKILAKRSNQICTISFSEKNRLIKYGFNTSENIDVVPLGVNQRFAPKENQKKEILDNIINKYDLPEKYILYVGRLNIRKNIKNLIKGFSLLKDKNIKLVLAGQLDSKKDEFDILTSKLEIKKRVIFTGFIDDELLPSLYSLATIFCYISFDEGFGLPPLEAMASGVPVIIADRGSLPEICKEAGTYVDPKNPEMIAEKMDLLLLDKNIYKNKRELGFLRAKVFNWKDSAEKLINICRDVLKK